MTVQEEISFIEKKLRQYNFTFCLSRSQRKLMLSYWERWKKLTGYETN